MFSGLPFKRHHISTVTGDQHYFRFRYYEAFLATAEAIIDVKRGKLVMEVAEHKIDFDIFKMAKHQPSYVDESNMVEVMEGCVDEVRMARWEEIEELYVLWRRK
ncbi:uncharacterized protein LOC116012107 [Ipomoea triloba]|uniref:uncharacterized protein LOC116012107 n=1 Tax=Ipomoea triloba TaxID=35885 RepID=UPI00125CF7AD|nr:uncharacterized protein LOC116012107 [Ipomoea triloba]